MQQNESSHGCQLSLNPCETHGFGLFLTLSQATYFFSRLGGSRFNQSRLGNGSLVVHTQSRLGKGALVVHTPEIAYCNRDAVIKCHLFLT